MNRPSITGASLILPACATISSTLRQPSAAMRDMDSLQRFDFARWVHSMLTMGGFAFCLA